MRIRVDSEDARRVLEEAPEALAKAVQRWAMLGGVLVQGTMADVIVDKTKHPQSATGELAASIQVEASETGASIGPTVRSTRWGPFDPVWVDQPTRPHEIRPRFAQSLAFPFAGGVTGIRGTTSSGKPRLVTVFRLPRQGQRDLVRTGDIQFAKAVQHPGTEGMGFIEETADIVEDPLEDLLDQLIEEEVQRLEDE